MSAKDKDQEPGTFMIQACRCRRCGGLLTSKEGGGTASATFAA